MKSCSLTKTTKWLERNNYIDGDRNVIGDVVSISDKSKQLGIDRNGFIPDKFVDINVLDKNDQGKLKVVKPFFDWIDSNAKSNEFYETSGSSVGYSLKSIVILNSDKAKQVFAKGKKNGWDLNKILTELQVPKEQKQTILDKNWEVLNQARTGDLKSFDLREEIITSLLAENSFTVEVNTAKEPLQNYEMVDESGEGNFQPQEFIPDTELVIEEDEDGNVIGTKEVLSEKGKRQLEDRKNKSKPTQHYSNLTVPGGTNYTENEISTPDITPNIKGHADFSTDNGIGWFRSDDKIDGGKLEPLSKPDMNLIMNDDSYDPRELVGGIVSKTRRVLEVQSDLFQKGRDKKDLVNGKKVTNLGTQEYNIFGTEEFKFEYENSTYESKVELKYYPEENQSEPEEVYYKNGERINVDEFTRIFKEKSNEENISNNNNQFLQLLNKKGNWVNFFIQSIIQDSAKKGYKKVLFPTGETAAKVEGHQTIADEIATLNAEQELLKNKLKNTIESLQPYYVIFIDGKTQSTKNEENAKKIINNYNKKIDKDDPFNSVAYYEKIEIEGKELEIESIKDDIKELEGRKQEMKTQGLEKLKPVEAFYTNRVTNILNKLYDVKEITDEHGNTWNEVEITPELKATASSIFLNQDQSSGESSSSERVTKDNSEELAKEFYPLLNKLGISITVVKDMEAKFGIGVRGVADIIEKAISVGENEQVGILVEEIAHFAVESIDPTNAALNRAVDLVEDTQEYKDQYDAYMKKYKSVLKVKKEVLGKLLRDELIKEKSLRGKSPLSRMLLRIWAKFKSVIGNKELNTFLNKHARDILDGKLSAYEKSNLNSADQYNSLADLTKKDFKKRTTEGTLSSLKKELTDAIRVSEDEIIIYENKYSSEQLLSKNKKMESLLQAHNDNNVTKGLLEWTLNAEKDSKLIDKRVSDLRKNLTTMSDAEIMDNLRKIDDFTSAYGKLTEALISEIKLSSGDQTSLRAKDTLRETLDSLRAVSETVSSISHVKKSIQYDLVANELMQVVGSNTGLTKKDLIDVLKESPDVNWFGQKLNPLSNSTDEGLRLFDMWTKKLLRDAELRHNDAIISLRNIVQKHGIKDFKDLYETDEDGKLNGLLISEFNLGKFKAARDAFFTDLNSKYGLTGSRYEDSATKGGWDAKKKARYEAAIKKWFIANTEQSSKVAAMKATKKENILRNIAEDFENPTQKEKDHAQDLYAQWYSKNSTMSSRGDTYYKGALSQPKKKLYGNPKFESQLSSKPGLREFYKEVLKHKERVDEYFPENFTDLYLAPQIMRDGRERIVNSNNKAKQVITNINESVKISVDDAEFGSSKNFIDSNDKEHKFIPIFFTSKVEEPHENLSTDLLGGMSSYLDMAERYRIVDRKEDLIKLTQDVYNQRTIVGKKGLASKGVESVSSALGVRLAAESTQGGKAAEHLKSYIDMLFYRQIKAKEGTFDIGGKTFDKAKMADLLNKYTAIRGMSLNLHSSIANVTLGNSLIRQEAVAKEFFNHKDLLYADMMNTRELPKAMRDLGDVAPQSKMNLFFEHFDLYQDYESQVGSQNANRTKFGRLIGTNALFFMQNIGEAQMQARTAFAIANTHKVYLKGAEMNLYEAYDAKDGKLILKEGVTQDKDGKVPIDKHYEFAYLAKVQRLNQKLHGIYNLKDRAQAQRFALGRLTFMFRKYLIPAINRRYGKKKFDYMLDQDVEGMYKSFYGFMWNLAKDLKKMEYNAKAHWDDLTPHQKANIKRTRTEFAYLASLMILIGFLSSVGDDDEDRNWGYNVMALQANRLFTEMSAYNFPTIFTEGLKLLESPAAGIGTIDPFVDMMTKSLSISNLFKDDEPFLLRYKSGKNKGRIKFTYYLENAVPTVKNIRNMGSPENILPFYEK